MDNYDVALATMDDDGFGCAITSEPEPWHWPAGKTFGELAPADRIMASQRAVAQLQAELARNAPAIAKVLDEAEGAR